MAEKNKILVVGSLAYDHVMQYDGFFKNAMIPGHYNLVVTASNRAVFYGGCSGNIAYSLKLLNENPVIMTVAGSDFEEYKNWLTKKGIDSSAVFESDRHLTASAFIVTDKQENQIVIFDPGAMHSTVPNQSVKNIQYDELAWAIIAPDEPERMYNLAKECKELNIPFIFDPAQQLPMIEDQKLLEIVQIAEILIVNKYESDLLTNKIGVNKDKLAQMVPIYIETRGAEGCSINAQGEVHLIKAVRPMQMMDPTGCGDAFRAGVLTGLRNNLGIVESAQIGSLMATYSIENFGTQAHSFTMDEFKQRYYENFGTALFERN